MDIICIGLVLLLFGCSAAIVAGVTGMVEKEGTR